MSQSTGRSGRPQLRVVPPPPAAATREREMRYPAPEEGLAQTHAQLLVYARDFNRLLRSERLKRRELADAHQQLLQYARDLRKTYAAEKRRAREVQSAYVEAVRRLTTAAEYKDEETANHIQRIGHYSTVLARALGWPERRVELLYHAAPMHDVGKIGVPDAILLKPGPLAAKEWDTMKQHALMGENILAGSRSPLLRMASEIAGGHHERHDGSGYPRGRPGNAIPAAARIVMLADVYDALRSRRPYKPAFTHKKACDIIRNGDHRTRPEHFDPRVLEVFDRASERFGEIFDQLSD